MVEKNYQYAASSVKNVKVRLIPKTNRTLAQLLIHKKPPKDILTIENLKHDNQTFHFFLSNTSADSVQLTLPIFQFYSSLINNTFISCIHYFHTNYHLYIFDVSYSYIPTKGPHSRHHSSATHQSIHASKNVSRDALNFLSFSIFYCIRR
jgi:hypothetical protein